MFGSRGKGNRRVPWRDGGAGKARTVEWRKQAMHAVDDDDIEELGEPLVALTYRGTSGEDAATKIYKFDQKVANTGIRYHAEYVGWWHGFTIQVLDKHAEKIQRIIAEI